MMSVMRRKWTGLCLMTAALLLLTGCFFQSPDDLYAVPKAPEDFQNLQAKIDEVLHTGAEYAAPLTGGNTQTVQLRDLDGDGTQEAIAFFRITAANNAGKLLKIYIFSQQPGSDYQVQTIIEAPVGYSAINSVAYEDLDGDGASELVVSWQVSALVYQLKAYAIHGEEVEEILGESYADYALWDLDKDNRKEILILNSDTSDGTYQVDFYDYDQERGQMLLRDSAPMSKGITGLNELRPKVVGYLKDNEPALFVTANLIVGRADSPDFGGEGPITGVITDIFAWREDRLVNITLNGEGVSVETIRLSPSTSINVGVRDINRDSIVELPRPMAFPDPKRTGAVDENFWSIQWVQYDVQGAATPVYTTYYNSDDGWYLVLPEAWNEMINPAISGQKITLSRRDVSGSGERGVVFSLWDGDVNSEPVPFLVIYKLTGPNRESRSKLGSRFVLTQEKDAVYAAELVVGGWDCGLTAETLPELFRLIQPD